MSKFSDIDSITKISKAYLILKLINGRFKSWDQYNIANSKQLYQIPRRDLNKRRAIANRLKEDVKKLNYLFFADFSIDRLSNLYDATRPGVVTFLPLDEFEKIYGILKRERKIDKPSFTNVGVAIWGLAFEYPEYNLTKDAIQALSIYREVCQKEKVFDGIKDEELKKHFHEIAEIGHRMNFAARSIILNCFNLVEANLNSIAYEALQDSALSNRLNLNDRKLLQDQYNIKLSDKLVKYPHVITGKALWSRSDDPIKSFIEKLKPIRDSINHISPFTAPPKWGGYNKIRNYYDIDRQMVNDCVNLTIEIISRIYYHLHRKNGPQWIFELKELGLKDGESV